MTSLVRFAFVAGLGASLLVSAATAGEVGGTITATFNGEEREWVSIKNLEGPDGSVGSSSNFTEFGGSMTSFTVQGHLGPDGPLMEEVIAIEFTVKGDLTAPSPTIMPDTVGFFPIGLLPSYLGTEATIEIDVIEADGEAMHLVGRFAATLSRIDSFTEPPDISDQIEVSGAFDVLAMPLELPGQ
jgi:hypothetical protein